MTNQTIQKALAPVIQAFLAERKKPDRELEELAKRVNELLKGVTNLTSTQPGLSVPNAQTKGASARKDYSMQPFSKVQKARAAVTKALTNRQPGQPVFGRYMLGVKVKATPMEQIATDQLKEDTRIAAGISDPVWGLLVKYVSAAELERVLTDLALMIQESEAGTGGPTQTDDMMMSQYEDKSARKPGQSKILRFPGKG